MGSFANLLFTLMLGWIQPAISTIWSAFTNPGGGSFLQWLGDHWILLVVILCVIGVVADLGVYIFRWKPQLVWKSFFSRLRKRRDGGEEPEEPTEDPDEERIRTERSWEPATSFGAEKAPDRDEIRRTESGSMSAAVDLSRWDTPAAAVPEQVKQPSPRVMTTPAGYVVPEDSPYRRPAIEKSLPEPVTPEVVSPEDWEEDRAAGEERNRRAPVTGRKHRRVRVTDLFSDSEEELYDFDAPQQVIDRHQAYRKPVYPKDWKHE